MRLSACCTAWALLAQTFAVSDLVSRPSAISRAHGSRDVGPAFLPGGRSHARAGQGAPAHSAASNTSPSGHDPLAPWLWAKRWSLTRLRKHGLLEGAPRQKRRYI